MYLQYYDFILIILVLINLGFECCSGIMHKYYERNQIRNKKFYVRSDLNKNVI